LFSFFLRQSFEYKNYLGLYNSGKGICIEYQEIKIDFKDINGFKQGLTDS